MNKLRTLLTWGLLLAASHVMGYNITVDPIEIETGKSTNLVINLSNTETNLTAYQMKLFLPTGVTVQKGNEGKYLYTPNTARHSGNFSFTVMDAADGSVLITCLSPDKDALSGTSGELLRLPISVASTATVGQTQGNIKEIEFTDQQSQAHRLADVTFSITLQAPSPAITFADANVKALCVAKWDTNGDGELSEAEAAVVTSLGGAFKYKANITSFDELAYFTKLATIGDYDFSGCENLTTIRIPESVISVGKMAFYSCKSLQSIALPSVRTIYEQAFNRCTSLSSVTLSDDLKYIGFMGFSGCCFTSLTLPKSFTTSYGVNDISYSGTTIGTVNTLKEVIISKGVSSLYEVFKDCNNIETVKCYNEEPVNAYNCWPSAYKATLYVPYGSKATYETAEVWKNFKQIVEALGPIPAITFADANVKALCVANWDTNKDGELDMAEAAAVTDLGSVFNGNRNIRTFNELKYFTGLKVIGDNAFYYCSLLTSITIPNSVTSIGERAFQNCRSLTSVTIPNSVTSIGESAFQNCRSLTSVTIPNSVTSIGNSAFMECIGLTSVTIPNGVTSIGWHSFYGCSGLSSVTIPNSVTSIGNNAFDGCSGLTSVTIPNSVTSIGANAFYECSGLTSVTIPNSVTSIGQTAFYGCSSLTSITIPNNVTSIGLSAFSGCSSLTSIKVENGNTVYDSRNDCNAIIETADNVLICGCNATVIPNSVTSIGWYAFFDCSGLTSIMIPNGVTSIGVGAFYDCTSLTSVTIPNSVTSIGSSAFRNCFGLTSLTIPNSVTSIGDHAFYGCSGLTNMTVEWETPIIINSTVFDNSNQMNATLYVPYGCKAAYEAADYWKEFKEIVELEPIFKPGDVNGDGSVDVADIASVISVMAAGVGTDPVSVRADVNRDGTVDVADIASVISIMAASARRLDIED